MGRLEKGQDWCVWRRRKVVRSLNELHSVAEQNADQLYINEFLTFFPYNFFQEIPKLSLTLAPHGKQFSKKDANIRQIFTPMCVDWDQAYANYIAPKIETSNFIPIKIKTSKEISLLDGPSTLVSPFLSGSLEI